MSNSFKLCLTHFPRGRKILEGGFALRPPGYGPANIFDPVVRPVKFMQRGSSFLKSFYPTPQRRIAQLVT